MGAKVSALSQFLSIPLSRFIYCLVVTREGCKRGKLSCASHHRHTRMTFRLVMREVDDICVIHKLFVVSTNLFITLFLRSTLCVAHASQ